MVGIWWNEHLWEAGARVWARMRASTHEGPESSWPHILLVTTSCPLCFWTLQILTQMSIPGPVFFISWFSSPTWSCNFMEKKNHPLQFGVFRPLVGWQSLLQSALLSPHLVPSNLLWAAGICPALEHFQVFACIQNVLPQFCRVNSILPRSSSNILFRETTPSFHTEVLPPPSHQRPWCISLTSLVWGNRAYKFLTFQWPVLSGDSWKVIVWVIRGTCTLGVGALDCDNSFGLGSGHWFVEFNLFM